LIAWRLTTAKDSRDQSPCVIATGLDITDQKKLEEQLRHVQKMETLGTLVGGIAHDFNNQLTIVLGNIRLVLANLTADMPGRTELVDAEEAGQRCADMTQGLLTFSKGRVGQLTNCNLNELVVESKRLLKRVLPATIAIHTDVDSAGCWVNADRTQLHQLLMNLAVNARDAMADGGVLTLATANREVEPNECAGRVEWRPGKFVVITVSDTGSGMSPEVAARIFEPFFTTKKLGEGTGLGLAMVFGIVQAHQGWITFTTAQGQGTVFRVYLPAAEAPALEQPETPPKRVEGGHERILVVDDEEMVRKLARTILERYGFQVMVAEDGERALAVYREHAEEIDLVLLDFTMPGLTGLQVLREMRQINPLARVIVSSGHTQDSNMEQLLEAGAEGFVAKPYRPQELVASIRQVLDEPAQISDGFYAEANC
jgi:nitrogen-specific signal transduction histidine kinase/CheY-like chemotaxis protein